MKSPIRIAIIGSGPTGLMAASQLVHASPPRSMEIHLFEKRPGLGRKLLIAGSSGLNISHHLPIREFASHYQGWNTDFWNGLLTNFTPDHWIQFIERQLGLETFLGTSQRYFVREMKASNLLKKWVQFLEAKGVMLHPSSELTDFSERNSKIQLRFNHASTPTSDFDRVVFSLGGGSWESDEPSWAGLFHSKGFQQIPFESSNVGYEVDWKPEFLKESEGRPLKKIELFTSKGRKMGELVITHYGLEGTPIYFCGISGLAHLDLKPDLSEMEILKKLSRIQENLSPIRKVNKALGLHEAAQSLLFHHSSDEIKKDLSRLVQHLKRFPLLLKSPRPLKEAISSKGGLALDEVTPSFELKKIPQIYCGGEMLDWDAPTGGFLIQACVSQGAAIARSILHSIESIPEDRS